MENEKWQLIGLGHAAMHFWYGNSCEEGGGEGIENYNIIIWWNVCKLIQKWINDGAHGRWRWMALMTSSSAFISRGLRKPFSDVFPIIIHVVGAVALLRCCAKAYDDRFVAIERVMTAVPLLIRLANLFIAALLRRNSSKSIESINSITLNLINSIKSINYITLNYSDSPNWSI